jgi:hypothetical protein
MLLTQEYWKDVTIAVNDVIMFLLSLTTFEAGLENLLANK